MNKEMLEIIEQEFIAYERVRQSGLYNMFDDMAIKMSRLKADKYMTILSNYKNLMEMYPNVRKANYE